jgi:hypothetical protein
MCAIVVVLASLSDEVAKWIGITVGLFTLLGACYAIVRAGGRHVVRVKEDARRRDSTLSERDQLLKAISAQISGLASAADIAQQELERDEVVQFPAADPLPERPELKQLNFADEEKVNRARTKAASLADMRQESLMVEPATGAVVRVRLSEKDRQQRVAVIHTIDAAVRALDEACERAAE